MILNFQLSKTEPSCIGKLRITFRLQAVEIQALRFLLDLSPHSVMKFKTLWKCIENYEKASFGLKELMPSIVNQLQMNNDFQQLHQLLQNDFAILSGLPKYTWTKNWYARNRLREIAQALQSDSIRFIVVKGMAETLLSAQALNSRTCRDIDLLINREDLDRFTKLVTPLGWACPELSDEILSQPKLFLGNSFTFRHPDGIIDLDLHLSDAHFGWNARPLLIQYLWSHAVKIDQGEIYSIPNQQSRILLGVWNLFDSDNLKSHQILKYLYDLMRELKDLSFAQKLTLIKQAQAQLKMGKELTKLILLDARLCRHWWQVVFYGLWCVLWQISTPTFAITLSEKHYYWLYHTKLQILSSSPQSLSGSQIVWRTFKQSKTFEGIYWKLISYRDQSRAHYFSYRSIFQTQKDHCISYFKKSLWDLKSSIYQREIKKTLTHVALFISTMVLTIGRFLLKLVMFCWQHLQKIAIQMGHKAHGAYQLLQQFKGKLNTSQSVAQQARPTLSYYLSLNFLDSSLQ